MATLHFADYLTVSEDRALPERIAHAFNSVRFGADDLSPELVEEVRQDVMKLNTLLTSGARIQPIRQTSTVEHRTN